MQAKKFIFAAAFLNIFFYATTVFAFQQSLRPSSINVDETIKLLIGDQDPEMGVLGIAVDQWSKFRPGGTAVDIAGVDEKDIEDWIKTGIPKKLFEINSDVKRIDQLASEILRIWPSPHFSNQVELLSHTKQSIKRRFQIS